MTGESINWYIFVWHFMCHFRYWSHLCLILVCGDSVWAQVGFTQVLVDLSLAPPRASQMIHNSGLYRNVQRANICANLKCWEVNVPWGKSLSSGTELMDKCFSFSHSLPLPPKWMVRKYISCLLRNSCAFKQPATCSNHELKKPS